ncbi:MAG TPA: oxidoreductase family protein [Ktedonobacterales bacterium]|nr:oxidoreductase family protein [Ktedonobacterales bacterium]
MLSLPIPDPITPAWLTTVLRQAGVLGQGTVQAVEQEMTKAFNSAISRLRLQYSADAAPDAPTRLILKRNIAAEWGIEAGAEEVKFYTLVASLPDHPGIIVPCYAATYDEQSGNSYLLLKDVSATHRPPLTHDQQISIVEGIPSTEDIASVVEALANLHAYWWEHPLLETDQFVVGYWSRTQDRFEQYRQRRAAAWNHLIANESGWFPDDLRILYEQTLAHLPHCWEHYLEPRFRARQHLTLIHGDAYFINFLCPQPPATGPTYLLDWQSPSFDIGGYDLANLCATFWTREQRHEEQREEAILRRYYATLQARGVTAYTWGNLLTDYQLGLIFWLLMPVQDSADGSHKDYWWPKMQCLVAAFRDWRCADLLRMEQV